MKENKIIKKTISDGSQVPAGAGVLSGRFITNPIVSCRIEDDEHALLFNPDTDNSVLIDRTGLLIWKHIKEPRSVTDIMAYLKSSFSTTPAPDSLRQDIVAYLHDLIPEFVLEIP